NRSRQSGTSIPLDPAANPSGARTQQNTVNPLPEPAASEPPASTSSVESDPLGAYATPEIIRNWEQPKADDLAAPAPRPDKSETPSQNDPSAPPQKETEQPSEGEPHSYKEP